MHAHCLTCPHWQPYDGRAEGVCGLVHVRPRGHGEVPRIELATLPGRDLPSGDLIMGASDYCSRHPENLKRDEHSGRHNPQAAIDQSFLPNK